jgi:hypothetical protein
MTTAEIKALVEQLKQHNWPSDLDCIAAIETLLARQAGVLEEIMFDYSLHSKNIRAILNPENET